MAAAAAGMASFPGPDPTAPLLARLCCQFPHVDAEVVAAVLESVGGTAVEALGVLCDLQSEALAQPPAAAVPPDALNVELRAGQGGGCNGDGLVDLGSVGDVGRAVLHINVDPALLTGSSDASQDPPTLLLVVPSGELWPLAWHEPPLVLRPPAHGWYRLILQAPGGRAEARFRVVSAVGEWAEALDEFGDALAWAWDGARWTEELSEASLNLLVGVDNFMERLSAMLAPLLPMLGGSFRNMLESPRKVLENQLARIIEQHDAQAVGMTHTAVRDLLQQSDALTMVGGVTGSGAGSTEAMAAFTSAAATFEAARQAACGAPQRQQLREAAARLLVAGDRYVAHLRGSPAGASAAGGLATRWDVPGGLRSQLEPCLEKDGMVTLSVVMQLQGSGGGYFADILGHMASAGAGAGAAGSGPPTSAESISFLDPQILLSGGRELQARVAYWSESLVSGSVVVGSAVRPMQLSDKPGEARTAAQILMQLLRLGFGYVVQGDDASSGAASSRECTLTGMLHRMRATLPLRAQEVFLSDRRRRSRLKDVMRVVRSQAKQGRRFSLRLNTDLDLAVAMLREHHEDNWVGPILESVWAEMLRDGTLVVFELWAVEDGGSEQLVAADFGHPHSTFGFYVATRYFDRSFRTCMPGFILAFAEAQALAKCGFDFWDLGGTNQSPMMQYKPQVAIEMKKDVFLDELHATHRRELSAAGKEPDRLCAGTLVEAIGEDDLWGAALCRDAVPQPPPSKKAQQQKSKAQAKKAAAASQEAEGGSLPFSPSPREPSAGGPKPAMQARLRQLHAELCAGGMPAAEAAVEALKRLTLEGQTPTPVASSVP